MCCCRSERQLKTFLCYIDYHYELPRLQKYGKIPYVKIAMDDIAMSLARFDLSIGIEEKAVVAQAATLMGTTMAAFIRLAAKEKAREVIERETQVSMSVRDFQDFVAALESPPQPNAALKRALMAAREVKRA